MYAFASLSAMLRKVKKIGCSYLDTFSKLLRYLEIVRLINR